MSFPISISRSLPDERLRDFGLFGGLVLWLVYTRVYWAMHAAHLALPPCPFYYLTGHPCPFCGGTRSFAYMWHGDVAHAVQLYPFGPLLFVATLAAVPVLVWSLFTRRDLRIPSRLVKIGLVGAGIALAISWALKLTVLPN